MFVLLKSDSGNQNLQVGDAIFNRPTPWVEAWKAFWSYLQGRPAYRFVFIPSRLVNLHQYGIALEHGQLVLSRAGRDIYRVETEPMDLQLWLLYCIESWSFGLMLRVWDWRLFAGSKHLTRQELMDKLDRLQAELDRLQTKESDD